MPVTISGSGAITGLVIGTTDLADAAVTTAKMANMATASVLGRNTAGTGAPEVLSAATTRTLIGADNASNLTSGTVATARLATGTANNTTYLRGDQTWATVTAGISAQNCSYTGTLVEVGPILCNTNGGSLTFGTADLGSNRVMTGIRTELSSPQVGIYARGYNIKNTA